MREYLPAKQFTPGQLVTTGTASGVVVAVHEAGITKDVPIRDWASVSEQLRRGVPIVGRRIRLEAGDEGRIIRVDPGTRSYDVQVEEGVEVEFRDLVDGRVTTRQIIHPDSLLPETTSQTLNRFSAMVQFPSLSVTPETWSRLSDERQWNRFLLDHPNVTQFDVAGNPDRVQGVIKVRGFISNESFVRNILNAFRVELVQTGDGMPYVITDGLLGMGRMGFENKDPSRPTMAEVEMLQTIHGPYFAAMPFILTTAHRWDSFYSELHLSDEMGTGTYDWHIQHSKVSDEAPRGGSLREGRVRIPNPKLPFPRLGRDE